MCYCPVEVYTVTHMSPSISLCVNVLLRSALLHTCLPLSLYVNVLLRSTLTHMSPSISVCVFCYNARWYTHVSIYLLLSVYVSCYNVHTYLPSIFVCVCVCWSLSAGTAEPSVPSVCAGMSTAVQPAGPPVPDTHHFTAGHQHC